MADAGRAIAKVSTTFDFGFLQSAKSCPELSLARSMNRVLVGVVVSASLLVAGCGRATRVPSSATVPSVRQASSLTVTHPIPSLDLEVAGLTPVAESVTPFQISSIDNGRSIMLIGAYADTARTVFIFRETPDMGLPNVRVSDEQGLVSAGGSAGPVHAPGSAATTLSHSTRGYIQDPTGSP